MKNPKYRNDNERAKVMWLKKGNKEYECCSNVLCQKKCKGKHKRRVNWQICFC